MKSTHINACFEWLECNLLCILCVCLCVCVCVNLKGLTCLTQRSKHTMHALSAYKTNSRCTLYILISNHHIDRCYIRRKCMYILYIIYILEWIWHEHKKDNQNAKIYNNRTGIKIKQSNNTISSKNPEMKPDASCFSVFYFRFLTWGLKLL
jgi:hypothetical protein